MSLRIFHGLNNESVLSRRTATAKVGQHVLRLLPGIFIMSLMAILPGFGGVAEAQDSPSVGQPSLKPWLATISGQSVNMRTGPSTNHYAFAQLNRDVSIIAIGGSGNWVEIIVPSDLPIWIHGDFVKEDANQKLRVTGNSVRLRCSANTKYTPVGITESGQLLRPTGNKSPDGKWVEIFAPLNARGWIHGDYVRRSDRVVNPAMLSSLHDSLKAKSTTSIGDLAGSGEDDTETDPASSADSASNDTGSEAVEVSKDSVPEDGSIKIPAFESDRLKELFEQFRLETEKPPVQWDFSGIFRKIQVYETTSEDLGEIRVVKNLARTINEHFVPLQRRLIEIERQQKIAQANREKELAREKEILRRTGHRNTPGDQKYQAVGWVVPLGKHRKVEATHKLMKGSKLLYYLDGEKLNLDQYVNKRVGLVGTIQEQDPETGARLLVIQKIEILSR
ncbi:MAG: hypothetical protein CBC13_03205 [Planctomycetia bacterium TMED53]|nr:MAG: hypothetical protein CBC13_03205 [Planctomycetia bacterium TMED53]